MSRYEPSPAAAGEGRVGVPSSGAGFQPASGQHGRPTAQLSSQEVHWHRAEAMAVRPAGGQTIALRVGLASPADLGRGLLRLHPSAATQLGAAPGDAVAIEAPSAPGSQRAFASIVLDDQQPRDAVGIDGLLRRAAGIGLGELATLRLVSAGQALAVKAERAALASTLKSSELAGLLDRVVVGAGSLVQPVQDLLLRVVGATPEGPVRIDRQTLIQVEEASSRLTDTGVWYEDIGGLDLELERIREIVELPLLRPELFQRLGVIPPRGVLLHGAPGTGKTLLARAVANECRANFVHINGPDLMHKFYGESEQRLKQLFEDAAAQAPSIIFIDEIDAIAPKRAEVLGEMEKRVVAQFLALMDGFVSRGQVVVIGATNLPQALDPALRRPGRFDREVEIGQPDRSARLAILRIHTRAMPLAAGVDLASLAERTSGFVGADLEALCQEAGMAAIRRLTAAHFVIPTATRNPAAGGTDASLTPEIDTADFLDAFHAVEPTAAREIVREQTIENFASVGGYDKLKVSLRTIFSRPGLSRGVLLVGPTGVGKTLLARATAGELGLPLIAVDGPLLYSKWLGESEKAVADVFAKARHNAPCVLLLDQLEAIGDVRLDSASVGQRMVGQLVRELDGIAAFPEVALIAATNRAELIDPSVKRRFDYFFEVPLPDDADRESIWQLLLSPAACHPEERSDEGSVPIRQPAAHSLPDMQPLLTQSAGLTGADIAAAVRRARLAAVEAGSKVSAQNSELETRLQEALCPFITK